MSVTRQQTVHRVRKGYADTVTCWCRTETGRMDLSGRVMTVAIRPYGKTHILTTLDATADEQGKAMYTMPHKDTRLTPGTYRFDVLADGAPVYTAVLEIV